MRHIQRDLLEPHLLLDVKLAFEALLRAPLEEYSKLQHGKAPIVVLIDALDEATTSKSAFFSNPVLELLREHLSKLPGVNFVLTSRFVLI